jgi:hypothetical protein
LFKALFNDVIFVKSKNFYFALTQLRIIPILYVFPVKPPHF